MGPHQKKITTYAEFWPFYLSVHAKRSTRILHFVGTLCVLSLMVAAFALQNYWILFFTPLAGYSFAWFSHFVIEKNRPATFSYPLWSLYSDFKMAWLILIGKL